MLYSVSVAEWPPVWERAVHSVYCVSFVNVYQFLCVSYLPVWFEGGMWYLIVLMPDHCLSIYFFIHFMWNDHECKILCIVWLWKMGFYRLANEHDLNYKTHCWHGRCKWCYMYIYAAQPALRKCVFKTRNACRKAMVMIISTVCVYFEYERRAEILTLLKIIDYSSKIILFFFKMFHIFIFAYLPSSRGSSAFPMRTLK